MATGYSISTGEATENVMVKYLTKGIAYEFYKFHIYFFLSVLNTSIQNIEFPKAKHAAHMCGGTKTSKHKGLRNTLQIA